jgi:hypothetical protein
MRETVSGRKVGGVEEARILLAEWEASGESMARWCERRGLNWYSLSAFKGVRGRVPGVPQLVEIALEVPQMPVVRRSSWYRVATDHAVVEVTDDFRDDTLRRLLRVVAAW